MYGQKFTEDSSLSRSWKIVTKSLFYSYLIIICFMIQSYAAKYDVVRSTFKNDQIIEQCDVEV